MNVQAEIIKDNIVSKIAVQPICFLYEEILQIVYVINADGTNRTQLTLLGGTRPSWSP